MRTFDYEKTAHQIIDDEIISVMQRDFDKYNRSVNSLDFILWDIREPKNLLVFSGRDVLLFGHLQPALHPSYKLPYPFCVTTYYMWY